MPREHGESGEFVETIPLEDILDVFDVVDGPVVLSADVAEEFDCTRETARRKLKQLHDRGDLERRKVARRVIYWRPRERRETPRERPDTRDDQTPTASDAASEGDSERRDSGAALEGATDAVDDRDGVDLEQLLEGWPPASERKREQRRRAGIATLEYIRDLGAAKANDVKRDVEPDAPVDGQSPDTWWKKAARPALKRARDAGLVTFDKGTKVWEWVGDDDA